MWIIPKLESDAVKCERKKHKAVLKYLRDKYSSIADKYQDVPIPAAKISSDCPIWICWFQGIEKAPLIIRKCVESVKRHSGNHPVVI